VRDWGATVRERLGELGLTAPQQDEIVAELASHLEDVHEKRRADGLSDSEAVRRTLDEVTDWRLLAKKIFDAKHQEESMNDRTRKFWLPGFVGLTASMGLLMILQRAGVQPHVQWLRSGPELTLYLPWLIAQPLIGAVGAYLSRRAGGATPMRLGAGLFPAIAMLGLFCLMLPVGIAIQRDAFVLHHPAYLASVAFVWVVAPATGLLLGALPFLRVAKPQVA
jgi:hypothetical protein